MFFKLAVVSAAIMLRPTQAGFRPGVGSFPHLAAASFQASYRPELQRKPLLETVAVPVATRAEPLPIAAHDELACLPATPGAAGSLWRDDKGVVRRVPQRNVERRAINNQTAVTRFAAWMRDWGYTGWMISDDLVAHYVNFCADEALEEMHHDELRSRIAALRGVVAGRKRINGPQFADLRRYLAKTGRLRAEPHLNRFEVFRVASHEEMAAEQTPRRRRAA